MIPVAWTLAIELQFYLVAPFIVTRSLVFCFALLAAALLIRFRVPGSYTFAPAAWCFFLIGHVSHRLSVRLSERILRQIAIAAITSLPLLGYLCSVSESLNLDRPQFWVFYLSASAAIPAIFTLTKTWRIDSFLGELSYPIYISHMLVIGLVMYSWNQHLSFIPYDYHGLVCIVAVVIVAVLVHVLIQRPVDMRRESWRHQTIAALDRVWRDQFANVANSIVSLLRWGTRSPLQSGRSGDFRDQVAAEQWVPSERSRR